jgi:Ca-activated chloride channel family protein
VQLAHNTTIPNRDFVLDFRVAGETLKSNLMTYWDADTSQGYFTMMLYPPASYSTVARSPMEMVFVLDCSGSMHGKPLDQAKSAVGAALDQLQEGDTFQIIRFSDNSSRLGATPVPATRDNIRKARSYLASLNSGGGTQMIEGIKAALDFPHDESRLRFVTFMTDGYIGNEQDIIGAVHERIGASRIFSFGVGSSVNRYLLERMAREGRGAVAYLGPQDSARTIMEEFFGRISHPVLTDVRIDWGGMAATDVYPAKIPDMFVGRAIVVTGKYAGVSGGVSISGQSGSKRRRIDLATDVSDTSMAFIAKIWARLRIADLVDRQSWEADPYGELAAAIKSTALSYQLVSDYTSFIAVDASRVTEGGHGITVPQAVPVPAGVRYETTVKQD